MTLGAVKETWMSREKHDLALRPGEGRHVQFGPNRIQVKIDANTDARGLTVIESSFPPGAGSGPRHVHYAFEEAFYVLDGVIEYRIGNDRVIATKGTTLFVPAGAAHGFTNVGSGLARHLALSSSPYVASMIEEIGRSGLEHAAEVSARFDSALAE
jgi:quercetin dioxygenase-like cupin family protein